MTIRPATHADIPDILAMGHAFAESPAYAHIFTLSDPHVTALVGGAIDAATALVIVAEGRDGMLTGVLILNLYEHPMSGDLVASETVWWVTPGARGSHAGMRMLRYGEAWARDQGAVKLQMIAPSQRLAEFYEATGYLAVERWYQRRL